jgi:branched-chain amino acid aminotransferase
MPTTLHSYVRGEFVPHENAFLHISDLSIQRGYGVFDFFKVSNGHPIFLNDYLERFYHSASVMRLEVSQTPNELRSVIYKLIDKNDMPESGIKMILTGGYSADGYQPHGSSLIITQQPLTLPSKDLIEKGIKVITYDYVRDFPHAKTINYTMGIWLTKLVADNNAADVLYQKNSVVSEFPRCNFFMVRKDGVVVTPGKNILYGVTRKQVLELSKRYYQSREGEITLDDIYDASEAFLTSTTKRIVPIVQVDGITIGEGKPGPVTLALLSHLTALENADIRH